MDEYVLEIVPTTYEILVVSGRVETTVSERL